MKYLILSIIALFSCISVAFAQLYDDDLYPLKTPKTDNSKQIDYNNISIKDGEVVWQSIFENNRQIADLMQSLIENKLIVKILTQTDNRIVGESKIIYPMTKEAGYKATTVPSIAAPGMPIKGILTYEFKEGRYRVTFSKIEYFMLAGLSGKASVNSGLESNTIRIGNSYWVANPIETTLLKNGKFRDKKQLSTILTIFDYSFEKTFEIKAPVIDNDW